MSAKPHVHSDSEDDEEYVPPACEELDSGSESENQSKRQRVEPAEHTAEEIEDKERNRDALWASFQASVASSSTQPKGEPSVGQMVKVQKRYLFAGDYITEIVQVPADSPDAKKWPLYEDPETKPDSESPSTSNIGITPSLSALATPSTDDSSAPPKPSSKKPGPRKPKMVLGALPSGSSQKVKKLTTLDKSLMDWKVHTEGTPLQDELEANRRGGGYLDRVEFLQRVDERKGENLDAMKGRKRKKL